MLIISMITTMLIIIMLKNDNHVIDEKRIMIRIMITLIIKSNGSRTEWIQFCL